MKAYVFLLLMLFSCKEPNVFTESAVDNYIVSEVHYETVDNCRSIDILDGVLVAAASFNGYMRYNVVEDGNGNASLDLVNHIPDIADDVGDDAAYKVLISHNFDNIYYILDDVDNIFYEEIGVEELNDLKHCGNSLLYRDMAINDDIQDTTIMFTLQKHSDVLPDGFDEFSTSVGVRDLYNSINECTSETLINNIPCDALINPNIESMKISYSNNILSVAEGGLGVNIYKYSRYISEPFSDDDGDELYDPSYCNNLDPCEEDPPLWLISDEEACLAGGEGFEWVQGEEFEDILVVDGLYTVFKDSLQYKDNFYVQGGSASSLFSTSNFVVAGFDNDRGCYMALLDSDGMIIGNLSFADGYSINAIHYDSGFLALAAGNDGVLVYQWTESLSLDLLTNIDSGDDNYVYDVKVDRDNIYTASENGISIYKIIEGE